MELFPWKEGLAMLGIGITRRISASELEHWPFSVAHADAKSEEVEPHLTSLNLHVDALQRLFFLFDSNF